MTEIPLDISVETTAVVRAQQAVDRWRRSTIVEPFATFLERTLDQSLDTLSTNKLYRLAIRRVSEAIQSGHGNAFRDRNALLAIARRALKQPD